MTYPVLDGLVRPDQREMIEVLRRERTWLNVDDMGVGKTRSLLLTPPLESGILVVCPAGVRGIERDPGKPVGGWLAEAQRVRPDLKRTRLEGDGSAIRTDEQVAELLARASVEIAPEPVVDGTLFPPGAALSPEVRLAKARAQAKSRLRANEKRKLTAFRWPEPQELCVASYETMRTAGVLPHLTRPISLVFDEIQALRNPKALQTQVADRLVDEVLKAGGTAYGATGTPLVTSPEDLKCIAKVLRLFLRAFPGGEKDFGRVFMRTLERQTFGVARCRKCGTPAEGYHCNEAVRKPKSVASWTYGKPGPEAVERLRRISLGRLLENVTNLPPVVVVEHAVELDREALEALGKLAKLSDDELLAAVERERVASDPETHVARARASLAAAKRAVVGSVIDEIRSAGERVIFAADHRIPVIEQAQRPGWAAVLGGEAWFWDGQAQKRARREEVVASFSRRELDGITLTLGAGGTGVDGLQHGARHMVLLEESWSPSLVKQFVGRARRVGQTGTVVLHTLNSGHEIEARVHAVVERKMHYLQIVDDARAPLGSW